MLICVTPEDDIAEVMSLMTERRFRHLAVEEARHQADRHGFDRRRRQEARRGSRSRSAAAPRVYRELAPDRLLRGRLRRDQPCLGEE